MRPARISISSSLAAQQGAALLLFVLVGLVSVTSVLLAGLNARQQSSAASARTVRALKTAQTALLGYATVYSDMNSGRLPGYLPCPDNNGDGISDTPCGNHDESAIGRLPWQTLGLSPLRDNAGECLWYAVSGPYKENPAGTLSIDSDGQFIILDESRTPRIGTTPGNQAIAVVFAPGAAVPGQVRAASAANRTECGSRLQSAPINRASNYLETRNGIDNSRGVASGATAGLPGSLSIPSALAATLISSPRFPESGPADFNDTLAWITPQDYGRVFVRMQAWVAPQVQSCLQGYATSNLGKYPWPSILDGSQPPVYTDDANYRFGRIATDLSNTALSGLSGSWPAGCFSWSWWNAWRELVFYAVDRGSAPLSTGGTSVLVDGTATPFSLLLAGRRTASQSRTSSTDKGDINNYLESVNVPAAGNGLIPPGDEAFQTTLLSSASDDYICSSSVCP